MAARTARGAPFARWPPTGVRRGASGLTGSTSGSSRSCRPRAAGRVGVRVQPGHLAEVSRRISALSEVSYVAMVAGSFDLFAEVICRDPDDFTEFLTGRLHRIEGILGVESFMILQLHKLSYRWGVAAAEPNKRATRARRATAGAGK